MLPITIENNKSNIIMFKRLFILIIALAPLVAMLAQDHKVAHINTADVFSLMPEVKDAESKLLVKQEEIQKALTGIETEYNKKLEEFKNSADTPTATVVADRQKQLEQLQERYQAFAQTSEAELQQLRQSLLAPIQEKLQKAIKAVGDEHGFTYIFEVGTLPYIGAKAVDVAPLVKAKLGIANK